MPKQIIYPYVADYQAECPSCGAIFSYSPEEAAKLPKSKPFGHEPEDQDCPSCGYPAGLHLQPMYR